MGQTKYKTDWEKRFTWVKKGPDDNKATCTTCSKTLNISGGVKTTGSWPRTIERIP